MGGKVFDNVVLEGGGKPQVPRMLPELYQTEIDKYKPILEKYFDHVVVPRDAPDKKDFGDIDFLVGGDIKQLTEEGRTLSAKDPDFWKLIEGELTAELYENRGQSHSFGIPITAMSGSYVQVDVELSPGNGTLGYKDLFEWTQFMKGDGDLLQIIGITHRPLGLTCNDQGLHARLEQIEPYDKKKALLFLTRDPDQMMTFYGFDVDKYHAGFDNETELFDWVAAGRYFSRQTFEQRVERATDRSRHAKRPMYRRFVDDYMADLKVGIRSPSTRQEVLEQAIDTFDVREKYDEMVAAHNAKMTEDALWKEIKNKIPVEGNALASAVRAFRRWVIFENNAPGYGQTPVVPEAYLRWSDYVNDSNRENVLEWVKNSWRDVKSYDKAHTPAVPEKKK